MSVIRTPNFKIRDMVYSGSNSKIFCACSDRTIRLLDPRKVTGSVEYVEYID